MNKELIPIGKVFKSLKNDLYLSTIKTSGELYLKHFGNKNKINSVKIISLGKTYIVKYPPDSSDGILLEWSKQLQWASRKKLNYLINQEGSFEAEMTEYLNKFIRLAEKLAANN